MNVAIASPEVYPFSKTGGLADVAGALPKALAGLGVNVAVVTPLHKVVDREKYGLKNTGRTASARMDDRDVECGIWEGSLPGGVRVFFVDAPEYFDRKDLYRTKDADGKDMDFPDNAERYFYFSKVVFEVLRVMEFRPDVLHLNDWQTAMSAAYLRAFYGSDPFFENTGSVFTVHNLGYQGIFGSFDMHLTGLGWDNFTPDGIEYYGSINTLKAGFVYSDIINTVSKTYAREIQTEEFGYGLQGVLTDRADDLYGIVNGIDYEVFDPETDPALYTNFGPADIKGKRANRKSLKADLGLAAGNSPLFGMISRLADQKGLDILSESIEDIVKMGGQVVILGTGEEKYHLLLTEIANRHPKHVSVTLGFDLKLANRIYAASDIFLMPSLYEPCGLSQLISLRYGTVPLVRKTGGLADTVKNYSAKTGKGNGFVFAEYSKKGLMKAVKAAFDAFADEKAWKALITAGMAADNSWDNSAKEYLKLYKKAAVKAKAEGDEKAA